MVEAPLSEKGGQGAQKCLRGGRKDQICQANIHKIKEIRRGTDVKYLDKERGNLALVLIVDIVGTQVCQHCYTAPHEAKMNEFEGCFYQYFTSERNTSDQSSQQLYVFFFTKYLKYTN